MITNTIKEYPEFTLQIIRCKSFRDISNCIENGYIRIETPTCPENAVEMFHKGYIFVDRTIGVTINLAKSNIDYSKLIRFEIKREFFDKKKILDIALESFPHDRRFHVDILPNPKIAEVIIRDYVDNLLEVYACIYKGEIIGFIDLESYDEQDYFIHLAAVRERYRAVGASISLYAHAIMIAKEKGCAKIYGRISSENIAVMNLYSRLGGIFSDPLDVFVRNRKI